MFIRLIACFYGGHESGEVLREQSAGAFTYYSFLQELYYAMPKFPVKGLVNVSGC